MRKFKVRFWSFLFIGILLFVINGTLSAQEKFPTRPVTIVIHVAPGGGSTINAQLLQKPMEKVLGVGVNIVNKPGGGGTVCWNFVANSPADGYTVAHINPSLIITQYTTETGVSYKRFDPIVNTVGIPAGIVVRTEAPWKTFKEFIDYAKANPEKIQMANSGYAAMYHIGILGIELATGVRFTNVPFKGSGPCITAMLGGHADASLIEIATLLPYIEAKKFRVLAVTSPVRNFAMPEIPTFKEHGFDVDAGTWYAYGVPKGTPKDRIKILYHAFKAGMDSEEFKAAYRKQGGVVMDMAYEQVGAFMDEQNKLWKKIWDASGFKPIK